jgi:hypothetical protein
VIVAAVVMVEALVVTSLGVRAYRRAKRRTRADDHRRRSVPPGHVRVGDDPRMGFSATWVFADGGWSQAAPASGPYLVVEIHDSDIATVDYAPSDGAGRFHLGFQPRDYFEDPDASERYDLDAEATAFVTWARKVHGADVEVGHIRSLLAEDGEEEPDDAFVEETVVRLLKLLGLPLPGDLAE